MYIVAQGRALAGISSTRCRAKVEWGRKSQVRFSEMAGAILQKGICDFSEWQVRFSCYFEFLSFKFLSLRAYSIYM